MVRHPVPAAWHLRNKCSLYLKPIGRGELFFEKFVLEAVDSGL